MNTTVPSAAGDDAAFSTLCKGGARRSVPALATLAWKPEPRFGGVLSVVPRSRAAHRKKKPRRGGAKEQRNGRACRAAMASNQKLCEQTAVPGCDNHLHPGGRAAPAMPHYRVYVTTPDGHVTAPATVLECTDDQEAIGKAAQLANGRSVELWEGARFIVRFPSDER